MRIRSSYVVVAAILATGLPSAALAQTGATARSACSLSHAPGVVQEQLVSGQHQRAYRLFVPPGYDGRTRVPLVLDLHGSGGTAAGQARNSGFEIVAARERFAVATLEADGARWNVPVATGRPDDVAYVSDVIDHVVARVTARDPVEHEAAQLPIAAQVQLQPGPAVVRARPPEAGRITVPREGRRVAPTER